MELVQDKFRRMQRQRRNTYEINQYFKLPIWNKITFVFKILLLLIKNYKIITDLITCHSKTCWVWIWSDPFLDNLIKVFIEIQNIKFKFKGQGFLKGRENV